MSYYGKTEMIKQAVKYGVVGVSNTLITMIVIWVMMKLFGCTDVLSNAVGYAAGVLNSFIWNKQWTFSESEIGWRKSAVRFVLSVAVCYSLQLLLLMYLNRTLTSIDSYYNHLIAMVFYTIINFLLNKFYAFKA